MSNYSDIEPIRPDDPVADTDVPTVTTAQDVCEVFSTDQERTARVRSQLVSEETAASVAETFRALGDPTRVRILDALSQSQLCVCEIASVVGLSESAVSHQLRLLRSLRVVRSRRRGRMVFYELDDHHIKHLFTQALRHVEESTVAPWRDATASR